MVNVVTRANYLKGMDGNMDKPLFISFSHDYNKLHTPLFTTVRSYTENKLRYYRQNIGKKFIIMVNDKQIGTAELILAMPSQRIVLSDSFIKYDTEDKRTHPNGRIIFLLLLKTE